MPTDLRVVKTKEALHKALLSLLKSKPLETISISEICRKAKINRGTFYLHYSQIGDLFEAYFKEIMDDLANCYEEPYRHVVKLNTRELDPNTIRIFHHIEKYKPFYRIVFSKNVPMTYYYLLFEEIKTLFSKDSAKNIGNDIDANFYASYQANAILGMVIEWASEDFKKPVSYLNDQLVKLVNLKIQNTNN